MPELDDAPGLFISSPASDDRGHSSTTNLDERDVGGDFLFEVLVASHRLNPVFELENCGAFLLLFAFTQ